MIQQPEITKINTIAPPSKVNAIHELTPTERQWAHEIASDIFRIRASRKNHLTSMFSCDDMWNDTLFLANVESYIRELVNNLIDGEADIEDKSKYSISFDIDKDTNAVTGLFKKIDAKTGVVQEELKIEDANK